MTPTPQPKLTPEQIYEILDAATYHDADVAEIESVRTAVAGIIAEKDALRLLCKNLSDNLSGHVACESEYESKPFCPTCEKLIARANELLAYTGTED